MSFTTPDKICWRPIQQWRHAIPQRWRLCLSDTGSLTKHLIESSNNDFSVQVVSQRLQRPRWEEARSMALPNRELTLVREVFLLGHQQPWVFARSIIPQSTLTGRLRSLRHLDNRPLGALLFSDPTMRRGTMEVARIPGSSIPHGHAPYGYSPQKRAAGDETLWGRRSIFYLDDKPMLVCEIFLSGYKP